MKKMMVSALVFASAMSTVFAAYYVSGSGSDSNEGTSVFLAMKTIQAAVDAANPGDVINVFPGTYAPFGTTNKAITIKGINTTGVIIEGTWNGSTDAPEGTRCATLGVPGVYGTQTNTVLEGVTLRNGFGDNGGGVYGGTLVNCTISGNFATNGAGAASAKLVNCTVSGNAAVSQGGGAYNSTLANCTVSGNTAVTGAGAYGGTLDNCTISGNVAGPGYSVGGGVRDGTLNNCVLFGNSASQGGGAYGGTLVNCTVVGNTATSDGGGTAYGTLKNSIVWDNATTGHNPASANYIGTAFSYSCTSPILEEGNNISSAPLFVDAANNDFRLFSVSPCVGAGNAADVAVSVDMTGAAMIADGKVNMGALAGSVAVAGNYAVSISSFGDVVTVTNITASVLRVVSADEWLNVSLPGDGRVVVGADRNTAADARSGMFLLEADGALIIWQITQEAVMPVTYYVDAAQTANPADGKTPETAFAEIQPAVDAALDGDIVRVAAGVYAPIATANKKLSVTGIDGAALTIIQGTWNGSTTEPTGARCATLGTPGTWMQETNTVLTGFTLRNGFDATGNGGGVYGGMLNNCIVADNFSITNGAGAASAVLNNCTISGNQAVRLGGGAYNSTLNNCLVTDNLAAQGGGAYGGTLVNCTVVGNTVNENGGGTHSSTVKNSIVWDNVTTGYDPGTANYAGGSFSYSCTAPLPEEGNNVSAAPFFVNAGANDFRLYSVSPCVGTGNAADVAVSVDMTGATMISGGKVNMGAFAEIEFVSESRSTAIASSGGAVVVTNIAPASPVSVRADISWFSVKITGKGDVVVDATRNTGDERTGTFTLETPAALIIWQITQAAVAPVTLYVDAAQTGNTQNGMSRATAFADIQDAVDIALDGDTVVVADGVYAPISTANKTLVIVSDNGAAHTVIRGTWNGSLADPSGTRCATLAINATSINQTNTVLAGFTLQNGFAADGGGALGGTLTNCVLSGNTATNGGGAVYSVLTDCTVSGNTAFIMGGGARESTLIGCRLTGNAAGQGGGAYNGTLVHCTVSGNTAKDFGGGIYGATVRNSLLLDNFAGQGGGAYGGTLANCTVYGNTAYGFGGGSAHGTQTNSIVWGNAVTNTANAASDNYYGGTFAYSCTSPAVDADDGNIEGDPLFVGAQSGDFRLRSVSPCVGAGDAAGVAESLDMTGANMIESDVSVNMGAFAGSVDIAQTHTVDMPSAGGTIELAAATACRIVSHDDWLTVEFAGGRAIATAARNTDAERTGTVMLELDGMLALWYVTQDAEQRVGTLYVNAAQTANTPDGSDWAHAFRDIQAAVESAVAGDTIVVTNGVYSPISTANKAIVIRSVEGAAHTVIDGGNTARCATLGTAATDSGTVLEGFTLRNGYAENGGGSYVGTLNLCVLTDNEAASSGGGAYAGTLNNCIVYGNVAYFGGGVCNGNLNNCTVYGNSAAQFGGGTASGTLKNSIVWGNAVNDAEYADYANYAFDSFAYSCTAPAPGSGTGNIAANPLFVDAANGNFRLAATSPCVGAGAVAFVVAESDPDGAPMVSGGNVNMGAFAGGITVTSTSRGVPHSWFDKYDLVADGDYEAAENLDADGDGVPNWKEYIAGTIPTNAASRFTVRIKFVGDTVDVTWDPDYRQIDNSRTYELEGKTNLAESQWAPADTATHNFFRVKVELK